MRHMSSFLLRNGLLYRRILPTAQGYAFYKLCTPKEIHEQALKGCDNDVGDLGVEQSLNLLQARFYSSGMAQDIETHKKI